MNKLYFGDNLDIIKELYQQNPNGFIDLIYIDPPFNSKRNYNVLFESVDLSDTKAQKQAFADTWSNVSYLDTLDEIQDINLDLYNLLNALDNINISKGAISYLSIMAIRIWYMHKLLKDTGSFYLHCDPTMSHYLKIVCDLIFEKKNFRNEIVWHYPSMSRTDRDFPRKHDIIFRYSKSEDWVFNSTKILIPYSESTISRAQYGSAGFNRKGGKANYLKREGKIPDTVWKIPHIKSKKERLGYPTQKPEALLERIIKASSNEGDLVADFFCGCGTTIAVAQRLKRKWIGVDISHLAIKIITKRLMDTYGNEIRKTFEIFGFPKDIASARELATGTKKGRLKFEEWIVEVMLHGVLNPKRTQIGFDGYLTFNFNGKKETVLIEVKSGNATLGQVNHFIQTVKQKKAVIGLFVCFADYVTSGMKQAAKRQGYYKQEYFGNNYDKIQILTVEDILDGREAKLPHFEKTTFKKAVRQKEEHGQVEMIEEI